MWLQVHLEEPSAEAALRNLMPRLLPATATAEFIVYNGKGAMLRRLPQRLRGMSRWIPADMKILVLVDRDNDDCHTLKRQLEGFAAAAGLTTRSMVGGMNFHVVNRLAIEELEAWFFGDTEALHAAYPRLQVSLMHRERYRDPDAVPGGTWESLERLLRHNGYYADRMPKIEVAKQVSAHMDPARNRSHSFQVFRDAVLQLSAANP